MLETFVITLREGIEAALVVGILITYLKRTKRENLNRYVYAGLILAAVASLIVAGVLNLLNISPENEVAEGILLLTAAVFVASMVIWMQRTGKHLKERTEKKLESLFQEKISLGKALGLLSLAFILVFREGFETVLFLAALTSTEATQILNFIGGLTGLSLAVLFGVLFIKGTVRIDLKRFFSITSIILFILVLRLLAGGIHEFTEVGFLPANRTELYFIGLLVREKVSMGIVIALLTLPILMILMDALGKKRPVSVANETPAQRRKKLALVAKDRFWKIAASAVTLVIILSLSTALASSKETYNPPLSEVSSKKGVIIISLSDFKAGQLHKYLYKLEGKEIRFLVIKKGTQEFGVAYDSCSVCGPYGYLQGKNEVICKNCEAPIAIATIGEGGGCNPLPLKASFSGSKIIIKEKDLKEGVNIF